MTKFIVGISGKRGSGKTTLANELVASGKFIRASFAAPLKFAVVRDFNLIQSQVNGALKEVIDERYNKTPRDIMIAYGNFFRSIDPNYWVDQLRLALDHIDRSVVIDDMRFENEAIMIKALGGYLVRLDRDEMFSPYKGEIDDLSEIGLDNYTGFDLRIPPEFNKDLADLKSISERILNVKRSKEAITKLPVDVILPDGRDIRNVDLHSGGNI